MSSTTPTTSSATATGTCVHVEPGKDGYLPEYACDSNWAYFPNFAAAVLFTILFGISAFAHIYQAYYHKKFRMCWPLIMGVVWECGSFAFRSAGSKDQQSFAFSYVSTILVLLAPMWINACIYMIMGRMIYFFIPEKQIWKIRGTQIAKIFVWLDILSFFTQVIGGSMISGNGSAAMTGIHIYMGGIGFQEFCILIFTGIAVQFFITMRRLERTNQILDVRPTSWKMLLYVLFASLSLITTRIIFRLVEWSAGTDADKNPLPFHEAYFYCLDGLPMLIASLLLNIVHPGRVLQGEGSEFPRLTRKEKKAAKRAKKEAKKMAKEEKMMKKKFGSGYGREEILLQNS